jgi:hypothetical protein
MEWTQLKKKKKINNKLIVPLKDGQISLGIKTISTRKDSPYSIGMLSIDIKKENKEYYE